MGSTMPWQLSLRHFGVAKWMRRMQQRRGFNTPKPRSHTSISQASLDAWHQLRRYHGVASGAAPLPGEYWAIDGARGNCILILPPLLVNVVFRRRCVHVWVRSSTFSLRPALLESGLPPNAGLCLTCGGAIGADEHLAGRAPHRGTELCASRQQEQLPAWPKGMRYEIV